MRSDQGKKTANFREKSINFCPRDFNSDMADPGNLAYCREIQRQDGEACRKKRCQYFVQVEREEVRPCNRKIDIVQGRLF